MLWRMIPRRNVLALALMLAAGLAPGRTVNEAGGGAPAAAPDTAGDRAAVGAAQGGELSGTIINLKEIGVRGQSGKHKIALIQTRDDQQIAVDLGPAEGLGGTSIKTGMPVSLRGTVVQINDQPVFMANRMQMGNQVFPINRPLPSAMTQAQSQPGLAAPLSAGSPPAGREEASREEASIEGTIENAQDVDVRGAPVKSRVALIRSSDGRHELVDLGPVDQLDPIKLQKGDLVSVTGHGGRAGVRTILFADEVRVKNQAVRIQRPWISRRNAMPSAPAEKMPQ